MKRKPQIPVIAISPALLESAEPERAKPMVRCEVCGADANPHASEQLCWVCRRLKISAWRDVEQQAPVQE
jgi:hypothetical protein